MLLWQASPPCCLSILDFKEKIKAGVVTNIAYTSHGKFDEGNGLRLMIGSPAEIVVSYRVIYGKLKIPY